MKKKQILILCWKVDPPLCSELVKTFLVTQWIETFKNILNIDVYKRSKLEQGCNLEQNEGTNFSN